MLCIRKHPAGGVLKILFDFVNLVELLERWFLNDSNLYTC